LTNSNVRCSVLAVCALMALSLCVVPASAGQKGAKWTFAIYMCSDNDLDEWGYFNTEMLMSVGSTSDVNFVVLWDKASGPANAYKINKGSMEELKGFEYSSKEINMGDPAVLKSFVSYLSSTFKSSYLLLDLWDHGDDFRGICYDYNTGTDVSLDYLTHQEIGDALSGKPVSIIAADGCGIGIVESAFEYVVRGVTAQYLVANENYVPLQGFPYDWIAADLVANPGMSPEMLSKDMVHRYSEFYQKGWLTELTAIRLSAIASVVDQLWDVTSLLRADMKTYRGLIASGKGLATMGWSQYGWEGFVDFPTLFEVVYAGAPEGSQLKVEAGELLSAIELAVPYIGASTPGEVWDFGGISVFFPSAEGSYNHNTFWRGALYPTMQFAQDGWLEFLDSYFHASCK